MRTVDINVMLGPWAPRKLEFDSADRLIEKMDFFKIDEAYVYSSYAVRSNPIDGNYILAEQIKGFENRLKQCWVVLPTWNYECKTQLSDELVRNKVHIVRLMPTDHSFLPDCWVCDSLYEVLSSMNIPMLINQSDISLNCLHEICTKYPLLPVIITRCEYIQNRSLYKLMEKHPNVYLEVSTYFVYNGIEDIAEKFGAKRLIFGSRMPFQEAAAAKGMVMLSDLSNSEKADILSRNADRLINEVAI